MKVSNHHSDWLQQLVQLVYQHVMLVDCLILLLLMLMMLHILPEVLAPFLNIQNLLLIQLGLILLYSPSVEYHG